jgi:hypothetical protein
MCGLCGALGSSHWAEAEGGRRERLARVGVLNRVLRPAGLAADDFGGALYVVRDRKGSAEVVGDLPALWQAAERLAGGPLDPLDAELLAALRDG